MFFDAMVNVIMHEKHFFKNHEMVAFAFAS